MFSIEREIGGFSGDYQAVAGVNTVLVVGLEFLYCLCCVGGVVHDAEVFPDELLSGAEIEAEEVGVDCDF